ncbi:DNA topoisomerase [Evansella clarkii]|uniref:DNA topoisomerase n=1 Tax=Evansella clarkii TaxID=79879 RepID=UPI0009979DE0|nr:DNA topoisomerase [Evansella clarkii]
MTYLLLAEKPSAAKNFAKALGGMSGTYDGQAYQVQALFGHMLEFVEPHEMVGDREKDDFKSWEPGSMPWDVSQLNWKKQAQKSKNMKTGKITSKAGAIQDVKKAAQHASAIVIATDKDPSGEGQLIGWEVIQAIGWKGPVKRMYFIDESEKELQNGFKNIVDLPSYNKDGEYVKANVRSQWDFISMQLTRLATHAARSKGYNAVVRQGRLKSVMTKLVADQLALVKAYKKKPYFEVKYKDENGNVFTRKFDEDKDSWRYDNKQDAEKDMQSYGPSKVIQDSKTRKETAPGKLLDLGGLASILGTRGYKSKEVLATYQKMYEAKIVSYPRTEDKVISTEQFKEMLPLVDKIAGVVGADTALLTHRKPRKTHVKDGGAHGANRPGTTVPKSLDELSKYGPSGKAIYETLAKNFLAMFGENYVYDSIKGHIEKHPAFTTTVSVPIDQGFKAIFDADKETADEEGDDTTSTGLGQNGSPIVAEGVNKKPPHPSHKWLEKQLSKYEVGTGATRVSTLSEVTTGKTALLVDARGKLTLTKIGEIAAALLEGSQIGDPGVTEKLFKAMKDAGEFKVKPHDVLHTATTLIKHDKEVFYRNAETLMKKVGSPDASMQRLQPKPKTEGVHKPTGEKVRFNKEWGGHTFTPEEIEKLLNGDAIQIQATNQKTGKVQLVEGSLQQGEYKGKSFWGFQRKKADSYTRDTAPFPIEWSGYTFTKEDEKKMRAGEKVRIKAVSARTGKPFEVDVTFELREYKGNKSWGIEPHFEEREDPSKYTRKNAPFKPEFSGYSLTKKEIEDVRAGGKIMVTAKSKKGKDFTCNLSLELKEFKGNKFWGLEAHFN